MKICVAQAKPVKGDVQSNIDNHKKLTDLAVANGAGIIIFPELSLTGYEPELAKELAAYEDDSRFDIFQIISDTKNITIGVGMPVKNTSGTLISMLIFQPDMPRQVYSKQHIHQDETPYFIKAENQTFLLPNKRKISLAICYELSVPEHSENAFKSGAKIYIASVAKSANGVDKAISNLSGIANKYSMTVLMSNCIGQCDGIECGGRSSIWNNQGILVGQLNNRNEGILIIDTDNEQVIEKII